MSITIETYDRIEAVAVEWEALADRIGAGPFVRPGWFAAWHRSFGDGRLSVVCARRGGAMVGVIPVVRRRGVISSPTNWHTPLFRPLTEDSQVTAELIRALLAGRPRRLDLAFLDPNARVFEDCLQAAESLQHQTVWRVVERSPYIQIASDWASFESTLPSRRRSNVRRMRRRLEEQGSLRTELEYGDKNLEALLEDGFAVEAAGWKGDIGTAILGSPETAQFYREIAAWAAGRDWLRLWFLRLDGRALAFAYCLEHDGAHYELKVGFDPEYARFGPGVLLTRARLEHAFSAGLDSYEFLGQPGSHKLDWTDTCRERARLQAFAPTLSGGMSRLAWTHGRSLATKTRQLRGGRGARASWAIK